MLTEQDMDRAGAPVPLKYPRPRTCRRRKLGASLVAGTAILAAAGAVIAAPAATGATAAAMRAPGLTSAITEHSRGEANAYARSLLVRLRLPAASRRLHWKRVPGLSPTLGAILTDVVDRRALYHVPEPMSHLGRYLQAHAPIGMTVSSSGSFSYRGEITAETVTFSPRRLPAGIYSVMLVTTFKPARHGASLLRADAQVAWFPPRGGAVRIHAADYKSVTVSRFREDGRNRRSRTVSGAREVTNLVAVYNRLHGAPDVLTGCPEDGPSTIEYELTFHPAHAAPRVVLSPSNCFVVSVMIGGHREPSLYPATTVVAAAGRLLR